ncbi:proteasome subunit beta type-6 [Trichonephila inaurata madagascariensis]|uniref:Proteasome subunit beta n=1 Tax=Trichonephila inaurata madagascariensis TaxID=2747483 RepID=A0A8X6WXM9_9ARAC|nr:proteasome subunit beta type-6 [Trichonephila inaurata madagascariensis]
MSTARNICDDTALDFMNTEESTGTTIMAIEFADGVVIGADSRTSMGAYVSNRVADKLTKLTDQIYVCRSGSAADTKAISAIVSYRMNMLSMELGEPVSVKTAANDVRQVIYTYRESLSAGMIVAGWDRKHGGQVYCVTLGGMISREPCCIGGSGSGYIYGFMDSNFKKGMSQDECVELVVKAISQAIWRDGSSGGVIRIGIITEKGIVRKLFSGDEGWCKPSEMMDFSYRFAVLQAFGISSLPESCLHGLKWDLGTQ